MFQGCQKKIFYVKDTGSKMFEEAYFILRDGVEHTGGIAVSLADEAERIIREKETATKKSRRHIKGPLLFVSGVILGAVGVSLTVLILL